MAIVKQEVVSIPISSGSTTTLENLDGVFKIIKVYGVLTVDGGGGATVATIALNRIRSGSSVAVCSAFTHSAAALSNASLAGKTVDCDTIVQSVNTIASGDSLSITLGTAYTGVDLVVQAVRV